MDVIEQLGPLALATRLRRLADRLQRDVSQVYQELHVEFEARWFAVVYYLKDHDGAPLTTVAADLGLTHPAVNQVAGQLTRHGLLQSSQDPADYRRRLLSLTKRGRETVKALEPVWAVIAEASAELDKEAGVAVIDMLRRLEKRLDETSMYDRVMVKLRQKGLMP